jgi:Rad3-related DNA helicase
MTNSVCVRTQDSCRSAASLELNSISLEVAVKKLESAMKYVVELQPLHDMCAGLMIWFRRKFDELDRSNGFEGDRNVFRGFEAIAVFGEECSLREDTVDMLENCLPSLKEDDVEAVMNNSKLNDVTAQLRYEGEPEDEDDQDGKPKEDLSLSADVVYLVKGILSVFRLLLAHPDAYKLVIKNDSSSAAPGRSHSGFYSASFNLWCLTASVAFKSISNSCRSILLTSGTLSPLDSFASELGCPFPIRVETSHVINLPKQLFVGAFAECDGQTLLSTYQSQSVPAYQDAVGSTVLAMSRLTPGGMLVFFPSYGFMNKAIARWTATGLWDSLVSGPAVDDPARAAASSTAHAALSRDKRKSAKSAAAIRAHQEVALYVEPKSSMELDELLQDYYAVIDAGRRAILFGVCRGKVSEGIDFSNNYARAVIVVGIPFPALKDQQVNLKKRFQDEMCRSVSGCLNGEEWYRQQAYRAINQAVGRCIRHKNDYGAIILCDPRFQNAHVTQHLSKWLRNSVNNFSSLAEAYFGIRSFFLSAEEAFRPLSAAVSVDARASGDEVPKGGLLTVPHMFAAAGRKQAAAATPSPVAATAAADRDIKVEGLAAAAGASLSSRASNDFRKMPGGQLSIAAALAMRASSPSLTAPARAGMESADRTDASLEEDEDGEEAAAGGGADMSVCDDDAEWEGSTTSTLDIALLSQQSDASLTFASPSRKKARTAEEGAGHAVSFSAFAFSSSSSISQRALGREINSESRVISPELIAAVRGEILAFGKTFSWKFPSGIIGSLLEAAAPISSSSNCAVGLPISDPREQNCHVGQDGVLFSDDDIVTEIFRESVGDFVPNISLSCSSTGLLKSLAFIAVDWDTTRANVDFRLITFTDVWCRALGIVYEAAQLPAEFDRAIIAIRVIAVTEARWRSINSVFVHRDVLKLLYSELDHQ